MEQIWHRMSTVVAMHWPWSLATQTSQNRQLYRSRKMKNLNITQHYLQSLTRSLQLFWGLYRKKSCASEEKHYDRKCHSCGLKRRQLCGYMIFKENKGVSLIFTTKLVKKVPHHPQLSDIVFQHKLPKGKNGSGLQWQSSMRKNF